MPAQKTTKEAIIIQALRLFRRQGYHATSMTDLARACGLHKANFYHYFSGKEALMRAALEAVMEYVDARIVSQLREDGRTPQEQLTAFARKFRRFFTSPEHGGCLMGNTGMEALFLPAEEEFLPLIREYFDTILEALSEVYATQMNSAAAHQRARMALQDLQGGILLMQIYQDPSYLDAALERLLVISLPIHP